MERFVMQMSKRESFIIRPANEMDDPGVGELLVEAFVQMYARKKPEFTVPEARRAELRDTKKHRTLGEILVCEQGGVLRGSVTIFKHGTAASHAWNPYYSELRFLATQPELHGTGLGTPLMEAAERQCRQWGSKGISIRVRRGLDRLAAFYERRGFKRDPQGDQDLGPSIFLEGYSLEF